MKIFRTKDYVKMENPTPGKFYRTNILTEEHKAKDLGGIFAIFEPGSKLPYHYHNNRESIFICISGESTMIVDGKKVPIKAGDVLYIPPVEKHGLVDRTDKDFRYIEFFTWPPMENDWIKTENE